MKQQFETERLEEAEPGCLQPHTIYLCVYEASKTELSHKILPLYRFYNTGKDFVEVSLIKPIKKIKVIYKTLISCKRV